MGDGMTFERRSAQAQPRVAGSIAKPQGAPVRGATAASRLDAAFARNFAAMLRGAVSAKGAAPTPATRPLPHETRFRRT